MSDAKRPRLGDPHEDACQLAHQLLSQEGVRKLLCPELVEDVLACSVARGVVMYPEPEKKREARAVPVTLTPCPLPASSFRAAEELAADFHALMDKVCCDLAWMREALAKTAAMDLICRKLLEVCEQAYNSETGKEPSGDIRLHIMRNDFMFDLQRDPDLAMVQIELNMMAASFSTHCQDLTEAQRYALTKFLGVLEPNLGCARVATALEAAMPRSPAAEKIAEAMALAHEAYDARWQSIGLPRAVLFVSTEDEKNELDHRKLELAFARKGLLCLRRSLPRLASSALRPLAPAEGRRTSVKKPMALVVEGNYEVAVAYFRSGYWPNHFTDGAWEARAMIERSEAVKCPSAPAQLAGMKKVQQLLCLPTELRRFTGEAAATAVAKTFGRQYDPSEEAAKEAVEAAKAEPGRWVLKPQ
ncbi:gss, partial [Symbiodinium sp. CCMP2456]